MSLRALPSRLMLRPHMVSVPGNGLPDLCCHECEELETRGKECSDEGTFSPGKTCRTLEVSAKRLAIRTYQGWELNSDGAIGLSGNRPKSSGFSPKSLPSKQRKFRQCPATCPRS